MQNSKEERDVERLEVRGGSVEELDERTLRIEDGVGNRFVFVI